MAEQVQSLESASPGQDSGGYGQKPEQPPESKPDSQPDQDAAAPATASPQYSVNSPPVQAYIKATHSFNHYKYPCIDLIKGSCQSSPCKFSHDQIFENLNKEKRLMIICKDNLYKKCNKVCRYIHCTEEEAEYFWEHVQFENSHFNSVLNKNYGVISVIVNFASQLLEFDGTETMDPISRKLALTFENKRTIEALIIICHAQCKYLGFRTKITNAISNIKQFTPVGNQPSNNFQTDAQPSSSFPNNQNDSNGRKTMPNVYYQQQQQQPYRQTYGVETITLREDNVLTKENIQSIVSVGLRIGTQISFESSDQSGLKITSIQINGDSNKIMQTKQLVCQILGDKQNDAPKSQLKKIIYTRPLKTLNMYNKAGDFEANSYSHLYNPNSSEDSGTNLPRKRTIVESLVNVRDKVPRHNSEFCSSAFDTTAHDGNLKHTPMGSKQFVNASMVPLNMTTEQKALVTGKQMDMLINTGVQPSLVDALKLVVQDQLGVEVRKKLFKVVNQFHANTVKEIAIESIKECCISMKFSE